MDKEAQCFTIGKKALTIRRYLRSWTAALAVDKHSDPLRQPLQFGKLLLHATPYERFAPEGHDYDPMILA